MSASSPAASIAQLKANGATTVLGTVVNPAGLTEAKMVPIGRINAFADPGLGASPVWHGFAIDQLGVVKTDSVGVVGDQRVRIDLRALHGIGDGFVWAPGEFFDQDGARIPLCARGTLARVEDRLADAGLRAVVGHELEFVLVGPDGTRLPSDLWAQYGLAGVLEHEGFVHDVMAAAARAGVDIEQFHPEYGQNQFEISLRPQAPVPAADHLMLLRLLVGRVARRFGLRASLSPVPFAGCVGNGAHQHFSLLRDRTPIFSGGPGPHGLTDDGQHALAGLLAGLPEAQGILAGSILSGLRMQPGQWSGAHVCWGAENREAAVRLIEAGPASPHGANVEVKNVDPSANVYLASAAILGLALDGIERELPLGPETTIDPALQTPAQRKRAGTVQLPGRQADVLDALESSTLMRDVLGDPVVDMTVAVRRYESEHYSGLAPDELTDRFRLAWSV